MRFARGEPHVSFEVHNCEPRKESRCLCCYPIQLSRNRRPRKGGNPARPSRPCQAAQLHHREADPSDADTLTTLELLLEKDLRARTAFAACRDRGVYVPATSLSTTASSVINFVTPLTIPCRGIVDNLSVPTAIPASLSLHNLLCRFELWPVFQRSHTAQGPAVTTLPQVLFHRFRYGGPRRQTDVAVARSREKPHHSPRRGVPRLTDEPGFRNHDPSEPAASLPFPGRTLTFLGRTLTFQGHATPKEPSADDADVHR